MWRERSEGIGGGGDRKGRKWREGERWEKVEAEWREKGEKMKVHMQAERGESGG